MKQDLRSVPTQPPAAPGTDAHTHTPGPWTFARDFDENGKRPCITTVAMCCEFVIGIPSSYPGGNYRDGDPSGNSEDDARLIAAAPDLLEALRVCASQSIGADWTPEQALAFIKQHARAAIAKATGARA